MDNIEAATWLERLMSRPRFNEHWSKNADYNFGYDHGFKTAIQCLRQIESTEIWFKERETKPDLSSDRK